MGNLTEVKTVFTIDLSPYLSGLKSMLTMTQQTGVQLKPLLNLQIDKANFTDLEKTYNEYLSNLKKTVPAAADAAGAVDGLGNANANEGKETEKATKKSVEKTITLNKMKREALESFGAIAFLTQSLTSMAAQSDPTNKKIEALNQGLSQGISAGFGLAGILGTLGIASGGTAVAIGAVVAVAIALTRVMNDSATETARNEKIQNDFARSLSGMTIPQLEEYRKQISKALAEQEKYIALEKKKADAMEGTVDAGANLFAMMFRVLGLTKVAKEAEEEKQRTIKEGATIDEQVTAKRKTQGDIDQFIIQAKINSLVRANDKQRAEAKKTYDEEIVMINASEAAAKTKDNAIATTRRVYLAKIKQIALEEKQTALENAKQITDIYLKAAEDRFTIEMNMRRATALLQGKETDSLDVELIAARKARYKAQLYELLKIVGPLSPEALQKQVQLELAISELEAQEAEKRKGIKQNEKNSVDIITQQQLQQSLNRIRLSGLAKGKTEEEISKDILDRKKSAAEAELKLIQESEDSGLPIDKKTRERKAELETELTSLAVQGSELRIETAKREKEQTINALQSMLSNIGSMFGTLFGMEQQRTSKTVGEEKKRKQAQLDSDKERKLSSAHTEEQRAAIEKEYADKKTALDEEMDQKAKSQLKSAFALQKAAQIANAIMSTYSAAAAALAPPPLGLGPVFGPIVAATAIAAGLANVAAISQAEVPGLAQGTKISRPTFALIGEAGPEIVAPERTFVDVFKTDLAPRLIDVMMPQIKGSILSNISGAGNGGGVTIQIYIDQYYGTEEHFEKVLKPVIQDQMRRAGTNNAATLFVNQKST